MNKKLVSLSLKGFKSIHDGNLTFNDLNILIGGNGAGKSNLIAFFHMLSFILSSPSGSLQRFVAESGFASSLLHDGPKRTREIEAELVLETAQGKNEYSFRLFHAANDTLIFAEEKCRYSQKGRPSNPRWMEFGAGHREAELLSKTDATAQKTRVTIAALLRELVVYHFHDTSKEARIKTAWSIHDGHHLKYDAANI